MIEIKKPTGAIPGTTSVFTDTLDLISLGVNFTILNSSPFLLIPAFPGKTIIPFIITVKYYSNGETVNGFSIQSDALPYNSNNSLFAFLSGGGVVPDQSGTVTFNIFGNAPFIPQNNYEDSGLTLYTSTNQPLSSFTLFKISITYYLIDNL